MYALEILGENNSNPTTHTLLYKNQSREYGQAKSVARDRLELATASLCKMSLSSTATTPGHSRTMPVGKCQDGKNGLLPAS